MPMTSVEQLASVGANYCERRAGLRAMLLAAVGTLGIVRRTRFLRRDSCHSARPALSEQPLSSAQRTSFPWSRLEPGMVLTSLRLAKKRKDHRSQRIIGAALSFVLEFGWNSWFSRGFSGVSIQVS